jgi:NAD dependent epimerase/dehydratase family enzyme
MRIAVTGASGLIGEALVPHLRAQGHEVDRLVRRPATARDEITWDPVGGTVDLSRLEGVDAVVHLAG